jgi:hypothetical protein
VKVSATPPINFSEQPYALVFETKTASQHGIALPKLPTRCLIFGYRPRIAFELPIIRPVTSCKIAVSCDRLQPASFWISPAANLQRLLRTPQLGYSWAVLPVGDVSAPKSISNAQGYSLFFSYDIKV